MTQFWTTKGTITGHFAYICTSTTGFITNVYGPNKATEKLQFIEDLNHCATLTSRSHWIIGGDYNMIKSLAKKKGSICRLGPESLAFTQMIDKLNLIDLDPTNGCVTWNNKRGGKNQIARRLDCFLITERTLLEGWNIESTIMQLFSSDHWPINLNINLQTPATNRPFRFEKFWLKHPNFMAKVKQWWQETEHFSGTIMYRF